MDAFKLLISVLIIVIFNSVPVSAKVFSCIKQGKTIFTDDEKQCGAESKSIDINVSKDTRVNYRYPQRQYENKSSAYQVFIELPESEKDKANMSLAVKRLNKSLDYVFSKIPKSSHSYLKKVSFYIMLGPTAKLGGENNGLRYFPVSGDPNLLLGDKRWSHSIVIYNLENFLWLPDLWVNKVMVHELAHAWHYEDWSNNYPLLKQAWFSSRQSGLYLSQQDINGKILKPAYASTNEKEYFAELSAIYFVGGDYYPFNQVELKSYDPKGYSMLEAVWGI
ncbi:hypothetical protein [Cellvibrio fontiphilus]|jgi:hypothetical protein|uniref:Uncharacterized protein n=1 Tax=Cellvibrio fontiphilus TaxID=1815559 RepID=A0ABV7FD97_9GAMM